MKIGWQYTVIAKIARITFLAHRGYCRHKL